MMKKYDKLNLTSQIYKQKTPTKTQLNLKQSQTSQHNSFTKTYHNVCCPNCRYLFKIPKQYTQRNKSPIINKNNRNQEKQIKNKKNIQVQTQQYLLGNFRTSPKKEIIRRDNIQDRQLNTDRTPDRLPRFVNQQKDKQKSPSFTDRGPYNEQLATSRKKITSNKSNQKISNLKKQTTPQKQQFPSRSAYFQATPQPVTISKPPLNTVKQSKPKQTQRKSAIKTENQQNLTELNNSMANQLIKKIHLTQQINQIIKYHVNLPSQLSIPSYCKMLIYDMKQNRETDKFKAKSMEQQNLLENSNQLSNKKNNEKQTKRILNY